MRFLLVLGVVLLLLGVASLFVPIPRKERHGVTAGSFSVGVETTQKEKVHPAISGVLIVAGAALIFAGRPGKK